MIQEVPQNEAMIRLGAFLGVLGTMIAWEWIAAKRARPATRTRRWPGNLGVAVLDTIVTRVIAPTGAVGFAMLAHARGWGLLAHTEWPAELEVLLAVLVLDLAIYAQHYLFHHVPMFWRLHRMHHADVDVDVTTGARFHPFEILMSLGLKFVVIVALGAPALSVLIFEVLLNATAMFNHSNVRVPPAVERLLRLLIVTPDMHRIHHSVLRRETDSNFGFNLPWWDKLFGTYRKEPEAGHQDMTLGLDEFREAGEQRLDRMLTQPFREDR